jgi:rhamnogalacturonyl hydrolase YesR
MNMTPILRSILATSILSFNCLANTADLVHWDDAHDPAMVGKKVVQNFLGRGHYQNHKDLRYPGVVTWFGAFKVAEATADKELEEKLIRRFDYYLQPATKKHFPSKEHVDYAVLGVVPLEIFRRTKDNKYRDLGLQRADGQWKKTTEDGLTTQARFWVDDIYMIAAIQTTAYRITKDPVYLDRAALTTSTYLKKLQKPDGLFDHAEDSPFKWGRGVGWYAAGMTEILKLLPEDHPQYEEIMQGYRKMMAALLKHQAESGLWRQLVDKPDTWEETSGSGMFAYAMVTGVKRGWLDAKTYGPAARKAWLALVDRLDEEGNLSDVCVGTNKAAKMVGPDLDKQYEFYLARPREKGDYHGQAPLLWTAAALLE